MITETVAIIATMLVVISYLPQIIKAFRTKSLEDVSWGFLIIIFLGVICWVIYGILKDDMTFMISNILLAILQLVLIVMKIRYSKKR